MERKRFRVTVKSITKKKKKKKNKKKKRKHFKSLIRFHYVNRIYYNKRGE